MKKIILTFGSFFCFCFINILHAQNSFTIAYSVGIPTKDLSSFIGNTSFRGAIIDFQSFVKPNISVGISIGMNTFYAEKDYATYSVDNIAISGKQWRYSNHVPILLNANYYFKPDQKSNPFLGIGLGAMYSRRNTDMYIYTIEEQAWNFTIQPAVGVLIKRDKSSSLNISARYNFGLQSGNELKEDQSYLSLNLGFTFGKL
jgi:outer membrane protein W